MGILGAASKVAHGVGHEISIINQGGHVEAANTKIAQAGEIARQQQQAQAAKDAQRAAEDTHVKTGYDNAETIARTNYSANLATGQAIKNSTDQAAYSQTQRENNDKNNAADAEWIQALRDEGVPFKEDHGKSFDNLGPADAKDIVSGIYAPISNGQTGDDHGIVLLPVDIAKKTPLTKDRQTVVDWKVDPNTGAKTPVYQTFQAGTDTVFTAHEGYMVGQKKSVEADRLSEAIQKQKLNQADIAAKGAEANKSNAEAENQRAQAAMFGAGVNPQNMNLVGDEFVKTLPVSMQGIVDSMHHYHLAPKDLPRGKEKLPIMGALTHAYPDWSEPLYEERYNYLKEYGSSTKGDGATRNRLNTAIGHLDALSQASDALSSNNVPLLAKIATEMGVQVGRTPKITYDAIALKAAGESAGAIKGGGAAATDTEIENTYKSFNGDAGAAQRQANIDAQYGILNTQVGTIRDGFTNKMGVTPQQFGQPVLYGNTQQVLDRHLGGGGNTVSVGGQKYPLNPDGTFTHNGNNYKPSADGKTATLVGPAK